MNDIRKLAITPMLHGIQFLDNNLLDGEIFMQFNVYYLDGIFEVTTSGDANLQGFNDFVKVIFKHEEWKPGGRILFDHTELNAGPLTVDDVQGIANIAGQYNEQFGNAKLAPVVNRDLEYGLARMWGVFVESKAWHASEKLFRDRDEAVAWLKSV